jgi:hypothetical protein
MTDREIMHALLGGRMLRNGYGHILRLNDDDMLESWHPSEGVETSWLPRTFFSEDRRSKRGTYDEPKCHACGGRALRVYLKETGQETWVCNLARCHDGVKGEWILGHRVEKARKKQNKEA